MEYMFENIISQIPTSCLIEDYYGLLKVINGLESGSMSMSEVIGEISCVMECLAEAIDRFTPKTDKLAPSVSSAISMNIDNGILTQPDGTDLECANHLPISYAMSGGVCQCTPECMAKYGCDPEKRTTRMANGYLYIRNPSGADELIASEDIGGTK